jgi:hypothetical protein
LASAWFGLSSAFDSSCKFAGLDFVHVTPHPGLSRLDRAHQWVFGVVKVLGRMLIFGRITTGRMSANQAHAEVDPGVAGLDAVFAYMLIRCSYFDLVKVRAYFSHKFLLSLLVLWAPPITLQSCDFGYLTRESGSPQNKH